MNSDRFTDWLFSCVLIGIAGLIILSTLGCGGGGGSPGTVRPTPTGPGPVVPAPPTPAQLSNLGGMGPWSAEVCGRIDPAEIDRFMAAGQGNTIVIKSRTLDTGDFGMLAQKVIQYDARVVLIAQDGDTNKAITFALHSQNVFGVERILGIFLEPDEPDLIGSYDPAELDRLAAAFRAAGVAAPLGTNFSVAVGFPGFGIEMIRSRGVPQTLDFIAIEGYHITEERWHLVMGPACREVLRMLPPTTKIAMVAAAWADHGQPDPTPGMVKAPWTWWTGEQFRDYAERLIFWLNYRWSTDRCTSDCRVATDLLPQVQEVIREMALEAGQN